MQGFAVAHFVRYKGLSGRAMVFANLQVKIGLACVGMPVHPNNIGWS